MKKVLKYVYILIICITIGINIVNAQTTGITLKKNEIILGVGYSETLKYNIGDGLNSSNIVWTSSNSKVATVDSNGKVTAVSNSNGQDVYITASINGYSSTCKITVSDDYVATHGISLNKSTLNILINSTDTLIATLNPTNATNKEIIWTSSDNSIATVDTNGKITAKKLGTTIITATSNGYSSTCTIKVVDVVALKGITISKTNLTIKEKASSKLTINYSPSNATNKKITWKSSNTNVVKVDANGNVSGINPGSATITAVSNDGGHVATCKITVEALSKKVSSVSLDKTELTLIAGSEDTLTATINPSYAENKNITWETSDKSIATVKDGKVKAIKAGTAEIKVKTEDGQKEAICKVIVNSPPIESISFKEETKTVFVGTNEKLITVSNPINATIENPIWTSSNPNIAEVKDGIINALSVGETTITISNEDNTITASINIIVVEEPKEPLKINIEGYNLNFNQQVKSYTLKIGNEDKLKITTNIDEKKVTINGNQKLKNGSIITITINDEEKKTYVINIEKKGNYLIYFIAIISVLLIINLIRIFMKKKKKKY